MGFFTSIIELLARFFLSIVFFINGLFKSTYYEETVEYMVDFNIPAILAIPTIIFEMIFPLFIVVGYKTRISALALAVFTIVVALIFHTDFSNNMQMISFLKNLAIMGGLLIIISNKPQMCSIDYYLESKKR